MEKNYPTLEEALRIWEEGFEYRKRHFIRELGEDYIIHTKGVAFCAKAIAEKISSLNPEKAYVLGLLHDCGKRKKEKESNKFHGQEGYELMLEEGYPDVARICLTHTFPNKNFSDDDFLYPKAWKDWARSKLKDIEYDDYDRLIQLCDKFLEGKEMVSIEKRVSRIVERYGLPIKHKELLLQESLELKDYFSHLCGQDIYKILGVSD